MNIFEAFILGVIQGLTEFLPVSSSGHLALLQNFFGEVNVGFDVVVHFATLMAIIVFFSKDILTVVKDFFSWDTKSENFKLGCYVIVASIPIAVVGWFFRYFIYGFFSDLYAVALGFLVSGMFLFVASFAKPKGTLKFKNSFLIGLVQALALFPGISRSGTTISTGVLFGIKREKAIRFSFLLAIPALIGANILNFPDARDITFRIFIVGFLTAFFASLFAIFVFMKYVKIKNFRYFALYCWLLAVLTFVLILVL